MGAAKQAWSFWIDRGGTFTDVIGLAPQGGLQTLKLLSVSPGHYTDAGIEGIRRILGLGPGAALDAGLVDEVHIGTTVATNALLERKGAPVLFLTTKGLGDQLRIGTQNRPKLFVRRIDLPDQLYARVVEVDERISATGEILTPLDLLGSRAAMKAALSEGIRTAAIAFLHGYRYPAHERALAAVAREMGFTHVCTSHDVSPLMKYVPRAATTLADAYLTPVLRNYTHTVVGELGTGPKLRFMKSMGSLSTAEKFSGKDAVLSGPAGGIVGMVRTARASGYDRVIGFDMGGTSTDVSRFDGAYERVEQALVAGVVIRAPMLAIHTVAAGGGSILFAGQGRMRVGPESAGADPGPACYRKGGPLTVTDANVMTGRVDPRFFPAIFGKMADAPLNAAIVKEMFAELSQFLGPSAEEVADGFLAIAVANMAEAIKRISVTRGYDVRDYALNAFGGAAGQLACRVADALGMKTVLMHPLAGVLSALGIGMSETAAFRQEAVEQLLDPAGATSLDRIVESLGARAKAALRAQSDEPGEPQIHAGARLRFAGSDTTLPIVYTAPDVMAQDFIAAHRRQFGFWSGGQDIIVESLSVEAAGRPRPLPAWNIDASLLARTEPDAQGRLFAHGQWHAMPIWKRGAIAPGIAIHGPAMIADCGATIVVEPGWMARADALGMLVLTRPQTQTIGAGHAITAKRDPVWLEIANGRFMSIAEQMGATLEKTASSVNIKERLDFSCAIFDADGALIANAPHMPVHLGSMGDSVRAVRAHHEGRMRPGDVFVLNNPYDGGTHLPDITVVMPVFSSDGAAIDFFTAARGHHADIGGITPGSMPPHSETISEEGILIDAIPLVREGVFDEAAIRAKLAEGPYPARDPNRNIADLKAQIAACAKGAGELAVLCAEWGADVVRAYMAHVLDEAEAETRAVIAKLKDGGFTHEMDDGARIAVAIRVDPQARSAEIDFTGTSAQRPNNFNAPRSVTQAAVLYAFRCLVDRDIPLNAGCMRPLTLIVPEGSMLNPRAPAAVVAGNVETSQAVTDAIFAAMGVMAAAQGTMNNFTFGNATHQYYETICGGAGAGPDFHGASAVHTHMTNSRLTDPEILEWRFPVLLRRFALREGSGGTGTHRGGDGVVREIEFRESMEASILSTRRATAPFGLEGGQPGALGRNTLRRRDKTLEPLPGCARIAVEPGDVFIIETPGGGGFGRKP